MKTSRPDAVNRRRDGYKIFKTALKNYKAAPCCARFDKERIWGSSSGAEKDTTSQMVDTMKYRNLLVSVATYEMAGSRLSPEEGKMVVSKFIAECPQNLSSNGWEKIRPVIAEAVSNLAHAENVRKDYAAAIRRANESLRIEPNASAFNNRAVANLRSGNPKSALNDIENALGLDPKNGTYWIQKARIYANGLHDETNALEAARTAVQFGFSDWNLLKTDPDFQSLSESKDWFSFLISHK